MSNNDLKGLSFKFLKALIQNYFTNYDNRFHETKKLTNRPENSPIIMHFASGTVVDTKLDQFRKNIIFHQSLSTRF
jgi:hypothetical protein